MVNKCSTAAHAVQALPVHPDVSRRTSGTTVHGHRARAEERMPSARPVAMQREAHTHRQDRLKRRHAVHVGVMN
eukprot:5400637-Alexandrium_andersonii.AAC.1